MGISLGIVVAFFMISKLKEQQVNNSKSVAQVANITPTVAVVNTQAENLQITQPENQVITNKKLISIKGKANKDALIIIHSPIKNLAFKNSKTEFSEDFPLALGENIIKIAVYPKDPLLRTQEKELRVYYLDEK